MKFTHWNKTATTGKVGDKNDCTVRAFMKVMDVDYATARANLAAFGRQPNKGCKWWCFAAWWSGRELNGYTLREMPLAKDEDRLKHHARHQVTQWRTVGQFVKAHPRGRYVLRVARHVLPLVDGVVYDWKEGPARRLLGVTEAIPCGEKPKPKPINDKPTIYAMQKEFSF